MQEILLIHTSPAPVNEHPAHPRRITPGRTTSPSLSVVIEGLVRTGCDLKNQVHDKGGRALLGVAAAVFVGDSPERTQREKIEAVQEIPALLELYI